VFSVVSFDDNGLRKEKESMAHKITDECVGCGTCVEECPVNAISEDGDKYKIDAEACTDCGKCKEVCPADAIIEA